MYLQSFMSFFLCLSPHCFLKLAFYIFIFQLQCFHFFVKGIFFLLFLQIHRRVTKSVALSTVLSLPLALASTMWLADPEPDRFSEDIFIRTGCCSCFMQVFICFSFLWPQRPMHYTHGIWENWRLKANFNFSPS